MLEEFTRKENAYQVESGRYKGVYNGCNSWTVLFDNDDECTLIIDFSRKVKKWKEDSLIYIEGMA